MKGVIGLLRSPRAGNSLIIIIIGISLLIAAGIIAPGFLDTANLLNLWRQAVPLGLVGIGQTLAILVGGVDLSVGAVAMFSNILSANLMSGSDANNLVAVIACIAAAVLIGSVNGFGIIRFGINPFVMTLASGIIIHGVTLVYSRGGSGGAASPLLVFIGVGRIFQFPVAVLFWLVFVGAIILLLDFSVFGRKLYAVGANPQAAHLSGVSTRSVIMGVYIISALTAMLAGLVVTGIMGVGTLEWGIDYRLISLAVVVMGGTSFAGGRGGYWGTFFSVLTVTVLNSLLTILRISEPVRQVIYGLVILGALFATGIKRGGNK